MDKELKLNNVLVVTGIFPPDIGGPATYIPRFSDFLMKRGHKVSVITLSDAPILKEDNYEYPILRIFRGTNRIFRMVKTIRQIMLKLKEVDSLFCNGLFIESAVALKLTGFEGKSVAKVVGDPVWERKRNRAARNSDSLASKLGLHRLLETAEKRLFVWSIRQFSEVTCPGRELATTVAGWDSKFRVAVIENGVSIHNYSQRVGKRFDLITVSRLVPWKNVDTVIDLALQLNCSLAVVGDGPIMGELVSQASVSENIFFLGNQSSTNVERLLAESKVFVQLSEYEGLSFSLLQAMAMGLPCLISDIPANRDVFASDLGLAFFYSPKERSKVLLSLKRLLDSSRERDILGDRSKEIVSKYFDEEKQMQKMSDLLLNHD